MPETGSRRLAASKKVGLGLLYGILIGLLFAITYTQSPLYTSNQNQYFLHGLARAGFGYLEHDWLANTLDPTPVFSGLVYLTYRLTHTPQLFYLYYAILLGIYLWCLVGIFDLIFKISQDRARLALFLALVFLVHSAALRYLLSRTLGDSWSYILEDGMASQRLLGPVFQPSTFGVLLVVSIYLFLKKRPILAVFAAALAAIVHPTYLLSAAALTIAYMIVQYSETRKWKGTLLTGSVALLAVLPILAYVYTSFGSAPLDSAARAQDILVNYRIPFHALIGRWFDLTSVVKLIILAAGLVVLWKTRLFWILMIPVIAGVLLTFIQVISRNNALALLFPWRVSTFLVPLATTALLAWLVIWLFRHWPGLARHNLIFWISGLIILSVTMVGMIRIRLDFQRQASDPENGALAFAAANAAPGQYYLVPIDMQDFRLATGLPIYVEFKSIPYQDQDVLEWSRRIQVADLFYKRSECGWVEKIASYGVTHVIVTPKMFHLKCSAWEELYQDPYYGVYRLR